MDLISKLTARAGKGDLEAQLSLGSNYEQGIGVKRDLNIAYDWYKKAANAGSTQAMHHLSQNCRHGVFPGGVEAGDDWRRKADAEGESYLATALKDIANENRIPAYHAPKKNIVQYTPKNTLAKKILVVDNEDAIRNMLQNVLEQRGFQPLVADGVKTALARIASNPDIVGILLDYNMPQTNGLQLLQLLRKMKIMEGIPIVMASEGVDKELVKQARLLGVTGWIIKPFDNEKIEHALTALAA